MSQHSEMSPKSQAILSGIAAELPKRLRVALLPSVRGSSAASYCLGRLETGLVRESDVSVSGLVSKRYGKVRREINRWKAARRADQLIVQVSSTFDLLFRWFPALLLARFDGKRIVGLVDFESQRFQKPAVRRLATILLAKADALVTSTEWQMGGLRRIGLSAVVIPPMIETSAVQILTAVQPHLCVTINRDLLSEFTRVLHSFAVIKQKYPRAEMTIFAGHALHDELYRQITAAGLSAQQSISLVDKTQHGGDCPGDLVISLDRDGDIPWQLISAWSTCRPVLVPAFSLVSSIIRDNFNGVIYSSASVAGLADAVIALVERPERVQSLSTQGIKEAQSYQWETLRVRWRQILLPKK